MRITVISVVAVLVAIALASAALLARQESALAHPAGQSAAGGPDCVAACQSRASMQAQPEVLLLGEATNVTLRSRLDCRPAPLRMHVVMAVAQGGDLDDPMLERVRDAIRVNSLRLHDLETVEARFALIEVRDRAASLVAGTADPKRLDLGVSRLRSGGRGDIAAAIEASLAELRRMRSRTCQALPTTELIILFAADADGPRCSSAQRVARRVERQGARLLTVHAGLQRGDRGSCIHRLASSRRYTFLLGPAGCNFQSVFEHVRDIVPVTPPRARSIEIVTGLPSDVDYVTSSASPAGLYDPRAHELRWTLPITVTPDVTVTWRVQPRTPGLQSLSSNTVLSWNLDGFDPVTQRPVPAWVQVFGAP